MENNMGDKTREELIRHILKMATGIYEAIGPAVPFEWFSSDLTVTQLRVLLILKVDSSNMSRLAASMGVTLPTASGVVENLVHKELVVREADPQDRRLVICTLSPKGQDLIGKLWEFGRLQIEQLLKGMSSIELTKSAEVVDILYSNLAKLQHPNT
jgi:DNA-binding MarR family transcriptional regulator